MLFFFYKILKNIFVTVAKLLRNCRNCYETVGTAQDQEIFSAFFLVSYLVTI